MDNKEIQKLYTKKASFYHFLFVDFLGIGKRAENFFRKSKYVKSDIKILDAGCGTGNATRGLYKITKERNLKDVTFHAFDLTEAMLEVFKEWIKKAGVKNVSLKQANALELDKLPSNWKDYDMIISAGMLEYVPREKMKKAVHGLKDLLKKDGTLVVFITKRNLITRLCVGWWWKANVYSKEELQNIFESAGFQHFTIRRINWHFMYTVEARR